MRETQTHQRTACTFSKLKSEATNKMKSNPKVIRSIQASHIRMVCEWVCANENNFIICRIKTTLLFNHIFKTFDIHILDAMYVCVCLYMCVWVSCRVLLCVWYEGLLWTMFMFVSNLYTMFIFTDCARNCKSNPFDSAPKINRMNTCVCVSTQKRTYIGNSTREEESR